MGRAKCAITNCKGTQNYKIGLLCAKCFKGFDERKVNKGGRKVPLSEQELRLWTNHKEYTTARHKGKKNYCKGCLTITVGYKDALCYGCTSNLKSKRDAEDISAEDSDMLAKSENLKAAKRPKKLEHQKNHYQKKRKLIDQIRNRPIEKRNPAEKQIWQEYICALLSERRRTRRAEALRRYKFTSNYCGSTAALWPMLPGDDFQIHYIGHLLDTWNRNYSNQFDSISSLYDSGIKFHIDEIISVKYLCSQDDDGAILKIWNQVILWHKFNAQLLLGPENSSKGAAVDPAKVVEITEKVKAFYFNPCNRHYAINVVKRNIGTTERIIDEEGDGKEYSFTFPIEDWKQWYTSLNDGYNYDKDIN
mmetsp:Transcript_27522/g.31515  ORF Transcript_27522/g.31515 Transcript_27522/m.31515 type:complete len:362 (+) Transcript_27522:110-1195(+)